jgi:flagellar hook-basal body complex protein FliE
MRGAQDMSTINNAINAYQALSKAMSVENAASTDPGAADHSGSDFATVLKDAAQNSIKTMKTAETDTAAAIAGKADIREVVAAVTNAELTLQTVVTVRDKVISAYNDIIRMPV